MPPLLANLIIILLLIIINGIFALSEIAVVSARRSRLQQRAEEGNRGSRVALELISEPTHFFSTIQTGITLVGILAGAFGGVTIAGYLSAVLVKIPQIAPYAYGISLGIVVLAITYLTLIIGELLPKQLALSNPEEIADLVSRPMKFFSKILAPAVYVLSASTNLLARILGIRPARELPISAEEITILLEQGESAGVFEPTEQEIVESALRLDDLRVSALITPRMDITWLDIDDPPEKILAAIANSPHSNFPVAHKNLDNVTGIVQGRDILIRRAMGQPAELMTLMKPPVFVPESQSALEMLEMFKHSSQHMAMVIDEFGGLMGLVTLTDILEALVGDIRSPGLPEEPEAVKLGGGAWILDGSLPLHEFMEILDMKELPEEAEGGYDTLGGFVMAVLGRIPNKGDSFEHADYRFEVMEMVGKRVEKVKAVPLTRKPHPDTGET